MAYPSAALSVADHLVCEDKRADTADQRERRESGDRDCDGDEGEQQDGAHGATHDDSAARSPEKRDLRGQVEGGSGAESDGGDGVERGAEMVERRFEAEGEEDDAGDHRRVEVAVSVACDSRRLEAVGPGEPCSREDRGDVEVEPPERGDEDESLPQSLPP